MLTPHAAAKMYEWEVCMNVVAELNREFGGITGGKSFRLRGLAVLALLAVGMCSGISGVASAQSPSAPPREWISPAQGDVQRGAALYQERCSACHNTDSNKIGPAHRGVMGRRIGSLPGYKYSDEMARSRLRWTPQTLNAWLEDPEELVAGQRMGFQVDNAQERADLIAYLATLK